MPDSLVSQFRREFNLPIETLRQVADITARDAINTSRRWQGMLVFVVSEQKTYELKTATDNTGWAELGGGGGSVSSLAVNPITRVLTLTQTAGSNVTVNLSANTVLVIDGFIVNKGAGNTDPDDLEVGDFARGWDGTNDVAFRVDALPYTTAGNVTYATNNGMI